ncbi:MAG: tetratricopeptide repeat protein [Spartobacteria bacterium]
MADENPIEPESSSSDPEVRPSGPAGKRRRGLTPEQRRFLNTPRSTPNEPGDETEPEDETTTAPAWAEALAKPGMPASEMPHTRGVPEETGEAPPGVAAVQEVDKGSRAIELQQAVLILGAILLLGLTFYGGTKLSYIKFLIATRNAPTVDSSGPDPYPGVAAPDLVKQALLDERADKWQEAADRFLAAKRKDLQYRGILFRVGKILYERRNFDPADEAFERAIAFGENVEAANFYRGLIAVRRRDLTAAERFFEEAVKAAPFVSDYHYYWGETLRLDLKPKQSLPHYEQAILLARTEQDAIVCQFKIRMGRIEAAEGSTVNADLAKKESEGRLSVDWLMTAAALQLRGGHIEEARQLILQARAGEAPGLFASCVNDFYFHDAAQKYSELADALHLDLDLQAPFPYQ